MQSTGRLLFTYGMNETVSADCDPWNEYVNDEHFCNKKNSIAIKYIPLEKKTTQKHKIPPIEPSTILSINQSIKQSTLLYKSQSINLAINQFYNSQSINQVIDWSNDWQSTIKPNNFKESNDNQPSIKSSKSSVTNGELCLTLKTTCVRTSPLAMLPHRRMTAATAAHPVLSLRQAKVHTDTAIVQQHSIGRIPCLNIITRWDRKRLNRGEGTMCNVDAETCNVIHGKMVTAYLFCVMDVGKINEPESPGPACL